MTAQAAIDEVKRALDSVSDGNYYDILAENEPTIDWQTFAARLYRTSHSVATVTNYCKGICKFRDMLLQSNICNCPSTLERSGKVAETCHDLTSCLSKTQKTLTQTVDEIKQNNALAYSLLDDFLTWCDAQKFMPATTRIFYFYVTKFFRFTGIELNDNKLDDIRLPKARKIKDEYPDNDSLRKILSCASLNLHGYLATILDTGFEPIDAAQLQVKDLKLGEDPARINKDREKTGEPLEGFISKDTAQIIKQIIDNQHKSATDYVFLEKLSPTSAKQLRMRYNRALAKAGFGQLIKTDKGRSYAKVDKIDGHKFGKFHLKVFKKRWFSMAVMAGVPDYVAQGMLGRKQYLDQYLRLPLEKKQEFARKILRAVSVYSDKVDKQEVLTKASEILGVAVDENAINLLKGLLGNYMKLPKDQQETIATILGGSKA